MPLAHKTLIALLACRSRATDVIGALSNTQPQRRNQQESTESAHPIVGGSDIIEGSRPYLVSAGIRSWFFDEHVCGGSVISSRAVLTAAHCLWYDGAWDPPQYVDFFRHSLKNDTGVVRMYLNTSECDGAIVYHPEYDSDLNNDVAIIFLPEQIRNITPVFLNADNRVPAAGDPLDVAGWGKLEQDSPPKKIVAQAITVDYITNAACTSKPYRYKDKLVTDGMVCAFADGKDHCGGDSGGPLVLGNGMPEEGPQNPVVQVGIVSWSYQDTCANKRFPGVYTRISKFVDWIEGTVCERTGDLCPNSKAGKLSKASEILSYGNKDCIKTQHPTRSPSVATPWPTWMPTEVNSKAYK